MKLRYLCALPTWGLINAFTPFLRAEHPWKGRWFTLADWYQSRLEFSRVLDVLLWTWFIISELIYIFVW